MVQQDQLIARAMALLGTNERYFDPVYLPKSLYDQAEALGYDMTNYRIQQLMPTKDLHG
jgi:hypothetical protein